MAKNYDDYGYEDDKRSERTRTTRKLLIIVLIVIAIFLILYLLKGCSAKNTGKTVKPADKVEETTDTYNYENALIEAGKRYFNLNISEDAKSIGECGVVDLQSLINERLIDADKFNNCDVNATFVKVCILENGVKVEYETKIFKYLRHNRLF